MGAYALCARVTSGVQGTVRVHTGGIRPDVDYKTLFINTATTTDEVLRTLMHKFRLTHKDVNLFYMTMIVKTRGDGMFL